MEERKLFDSDKKRGFQVTPSLFLLPVSTVVKVHERVESDNSDAQLFGLPLNISGNPEGCDRREGMMSFRMCDGLIQFGCKS